MSIDERSFKDCLSLYPAGVTVVTVDGRKEPVGLTVSSFNSVSLSPPLVSICIDNDARTHVELRKTQHFTVNLLSEDQTSLSRHFAEPGLSMEERFEEVHYERPEVGGPVFTESPGWMICENQSSHPGGDHTVFLGTVVEARATKEEINPLIYYRGNYGTFSQDS